MVGASFALAISQIPGFQLKTRLVDAFHPTAAANRLNSELRTTALSHSSRVIFERLGIWQDIEKEAAPIRQIHVSEKGRWGATRLKATNSQVEAFGYVVHNLNVQKVLFQHLEKRQNIDLLIPAKIEDISSEPPKFVTRVATEKTEPNKLQLPARLTVLADGGRSGLPERLGITMQSKPYRQAAIVTNLIVDQDHQGVAYERFTGSGAMALLPLPNGRGLYRYALVWTVPDIKLESLLALSDAEFCDRVQESIGLRSGRIVSTESRTSFPLTLQIAQPQAQPGLILLGNAAHTLHPVAGQGFNLALRDAAALADIVSHMITTAELGEEGLIKDYLQRQNTDQQRVVKASDGLIKLFSNKHPALRQGRMAGLITLNLLPFAKQQFAEFAMGIGQPAAKWRELS